MSPKLFVAAIAVSCAALFTGCSTPDIFSDKEGLVGTPAAPTPGEKIKVDESKLKGPEWKDADKPMAGADLFKQYGTPWTEGVVYFDFDKSTIPETEYPKVNAVVKHLKDNAGTLALVEGHCDDRGSDEYNRGLGDRRANSVREYMVAAGIAGERIQTISYGEEKPVVVDAKTDADRAKNRRGQFIIAKPPAGVTLAPEAPKVPLATPPAAPAAPAVPAAPVAPVEVPVGS
jgi:outer membrane protein OmpA-like peptidoglycan-associated protein